MFYVFDNYKHISIIGDNGVIVEIAATLGEHIRDMRSSLIAVHGLEFLFLFCHDCKNYSTAILPKQSSLLLQRIHIHFRFANPYIFNTIQLRSQRLVFPIGKLQFLFDLR